MHVFMLCIDRGVYACIHVMCVDRGVYACIHVMCVDRDVYACIHVMCDRGVYMYSCYVWIGVYMHVFMLCV